MVGEMLGNERNEAVVMRSASLVALAKKLTDRGGAMTVVSGKAAVKMSHSGAARSCTPVPVPLLRRNNGSFGMTNGKPIFKGKSSDNKNRQIVARRRKPNLLQQQLKTKPSTSGLSSAAVKLSSTDSGRNTRKYYVHVGNNAELIRQHFRRRKEWAPAKNPWDLAAMNDGKGIKNVGELAGQMDFMWCQYTNMMGPYKAYNSAPHMNKNSKGVYDRNGCIVNHLSNNTVLTHKWKLNKSLAAAGILDIAPDTLVLWTEADGGVLGETAKTAFDAFAMAAPQDGRSKEDYIFIVKPGASTNRGFGIKVLRGTTNVISNIEAAFKPNKTKSGKKPWVVQRYIERPLLVKGRKFDIRCYVLAVHNTNKATNNKLQQQRPSFSSSNNSNNDEKEEEDQGDANELEFKVFLHSQAYLRTSCTKFDLSNLSDKVTHLTNDYVQNRCKGYGKGEQGNKLSLLEFADLLDKSHGPGAGNWVEDVCWPTITDICRRTMCAGIRAGIHDNTHKACAFELFGLDFMIEHGMDSSGRPSKAMNDLCVRLIEVNDNPCLEQVCPLLRTVIAKVVEDSMEIALDCTFTTTPQPNKQTNMFVRLL